MAKKAKRKMVRVHTRKIDRAIARKKAGSMAHFMMKHGTWRKHWREFAGLVAKKTA